MDTVQHAFLPAIATYQSTGDLGQSFLAGAMGALPDIGGSGIALLTKNWTLYNILHHAGAVGIAFGAAYASLILHLPAWVTFGFLGYAAHCLLDWTCHGEGKRWYVFDERFWLEALTWAILIASACFINWWFAVVGLLVVLVATAVTLFDAIGRMDGRV